MASENVLILSIDAWGNGEDGWDWNNWFEAGTLPRAALESMQTDAQIIAYMVEEGFLTEKALTRCEIYDDQYNFVVVDKNTRQPLYAIEYGADL